MDYKIKHIGEGKFEITLENGEIKSAGPNLEGMIRYTYFEDFTLPPMGWEVTQRKLLEDYHPKVARDIERGNFEVSHIDENGMKHYKIKDD